MTAILPEPDRSPLENPPIVLAVCQVRTGPNPRVSDEVVRDIYQELGGASGRVPRLHPPSSQAISQGAGASIVVEQHAWRLTSDDGAWTIGINPDSVALETIRYSTWEGEAGFFSLLSSMLDAVSTHLRPAAEARLGLRYINQITQPEISSTHEWRPFIDGRFLGPAVDESIGPGIEGQDFRVLLNLGDGMKCQLRHGSFLDANRPGLMTYLIDSDCYREAATVWSADSIKAAAAHANTAALAIFQSIATDELRRVFYQGGEGR